MGVVVISSQPSPASSLTFCHAITLSLILTGKSLRYYSSNPLPLYSITRARAVLSIRICPPLISPLLSSIDYTSDPSAVPEALATSGDHFVLLSHSSPILYAGSFSFLPSSTLCSWRSGDVRLIASQSRAQHKRVRPWIFMITNHGHLRKMQMSVMKFNRV